ncbi:Ig-like domain repeat protein [Cellulosimicrobium sp. Marseille-Q4280]|uniref:OmpL47-type beta-barrel domain-containing protein n=1 Tax=Cellulosimicrobium sp. Marseille-Q4280 TaxID=2937992 RepID=UPI00204246A1|nr:Ig-like domain repeat protein [Cellulosimicrobium sp. Marseille-Q4280]
MERHSARARGTQRLVAAVVAGLTAATVISVAPATASPLPAALPSVTQPADAEATQAVVAAEQVLTWTGDNSVSDYKTFPATATAGPATIVFENSIATGSTFGMSHTLTFDTSTPGYNHDVDLNILASPFDANGGLHEAEVVLTEGTYRYFCAIPGHGEMWGELVVTGDGGGGDDTTAPSVTAQVTGEQDGDGAYVGGATVTLAATDDDSGVAGVEYDLDGAGWQAYDEPFVVDAVGAHTLQFRATDAAGNTSEAQTAEFTVVEGEEPVEDTTAPVVEPMVMGEQDEDGAYVGSAAFMLHATDEEGGSGVASIEYAVDGTWLPYTTTVQFTEPGEYAVQYRATDEAGNVSEVGTSTFTVVADGGGEDTTAPTVTAEVTGDLDDNGAFVGSATATLTATDDASGVETVEYDLDGAGWTEYTEPVVVDEPGEHTLVYRATDVAGNVSEETVTEFTVVAEGGGEDTTAPTVATELSGTQDDDGAYVGSASVMITATDDGGVASVEYDLDGAGWAPYTEAVVVDEPGQHTLAYRATDEAGNVSEAGTVTFVVVAGDGSDTVAPEVDHRVYGQQNDAGEYVGPAFVRLRGTDAGSGVASIEYQVDGGEWTPYAKQISLRAPGEHVVTYRATDVAGNVSAPVSVTVVIEGGEPGGEGPEVTAGIGGSRNRDGAFVGRATVTLTAVDEESGVDRTEFQVDGGTWQRYAAPFVVAADGEHVVRYRAVNGAGETSQTGEVTFTVVQLLRDRCPGSDVRPTVVIDGNDSTVGNFDDGEGCTVNDHIAEDDEYPTHREFVRHVREVTRDLVDEGVLIGAERQLIIAAAELSDIGR